ncbi:hypothetical protein C8J56DRAFT_915448 [Mycena floridula]|nr:hypothetical protein C8J56DRAFT_915448 [Mycena floridula]
MTAGSNSWGSSWHDAAYHGDSSPSDQDIYSCSTTSFRDEVSTGRVKSRQIYQEPDPLFHNESICSSQPAEDSPAYENVLRSTTPVSDVSSRRMRSDSSPEPSRPIKRMRRLDCLHPGCPRKFTSDYTRSVHMGTHIPKPVQNYPCTMGCSEQFSRQHDRLRHEVVKHSRPCWSCSQCRRFFSSQKTLDTHKCAGWAAPSRWTVPG